MNKIQYQLLYHQCIDMRKEVLLPEEHQLFYSDEKTVLYDFNTETLKNLLNNYQKQLQLIEDKIQSVYFKIEKSKEKFCCLTQKQQEKLRSRYWFTYKMIKHIDYLLKIDRVIK